MARLNQWRISGVLFLFSAVVGHAQIFQQVDFNGINGGWPQLMSLVQGYDGAFYGTTSSGGQTGWGTVFRITPDGEIKTIYSFCQNPPNCSDGATPQASLLLATDGNLYGTTSGLGTLSPGTVFRVDRHGILTNVRLFNGSAGGGPAAGLVQGTDGNLYGTTVGGGSQGLGTIFRMTLGGALTTLAAFDGIAAWFPEASLIEGTDGSFYGTTLFGGCGLCPRCPCGTVFKVTPNGALTILHTFTGADGAFPSAPLVQASDGNFYGTTLGTYLGYQYFGPWNRFSHDSQRGADDALSILCTTKLQ